MLEPIDDTATNFVAEILVLWHCTVEKQTGC